jgi:hypothetical protein
MKVEQILASLTPESLRRIILELSAKQAPDDPGVMIPAIVEALAQGEELGQGAESWEAYLKLKEAIRKTVEQIPGMRYVEVDE